VTPYRRISVKDGVMRHGRKSRSQLVDGDRRHVLSRIRQRGEPVGGCLTSGDRLNEDDRYGKPADTSGDTAMSDGAKGTGNVREVVPFLGVKDMERSIHFYMDGLGFTMTHSWVDGGTLRWCWLRLGGAGLMLQEGAGEGHAGRAPEGKVGAGVSLEFICEDAVAIYREITSRSIAASEPQVGNGMWVTTLVDADGYRIEFEGPTETPEETKLSELESLGSASLHAAMPTLPGEPATAPRCSGCRAA
jgi:lactoylglutathione lyase